jgi:hypothetical protein
LVILYTSREGKRLFVVRFLLSRNSLLSSNQLIYSFNNFPKTSAGHPSKTLSTKAVLYLIAHKT